MALFFQSGPIMPTAIPEERSHPAAGLAPARPFRIVNNLRPLVFHNQVLYCSRFDEIFATTDWGEHLTFVGRLALSSRLLSLVRHAPLAQRVLRAGVYRMRVLANGNMVF